MTKERKEKILWEIISFIDDSPIGCEAINLDWEEWDEFKSEISVEND